METAFRTPVCLGRCRCCKCGLVKRGRIAPFCDCGGSLDTTVPRAAMVKVRVNAHACG